jgi:hypothetical protein
MGVVSSSTSRADHGNPADPTVRLTWKAAATADPLLLLLLAPLTPAHAHLSGTGAERLTTFPTDLA